MNCTLHVRFGLHKREAAQKVSAIHDFAARTIIYRWSTARLAGSMPLRVHVSHATRNGLLNMIDHLEERGWTRQQGYTICSVAVDLKISQLVDVPNMLVSAFLPEDIFVD
jgi:formamidase